MSNIQTSTRKNYHNQWVVESKIMLDEGKRLQLSIHTSKVSSGNLVSTASVSVISEDGLSTTHLMFSDFNKRLTATKPKRTTLKVVEEQHALVDVAEVIAEAKLFYKLV